MDRWYTLTSFPTDGGTTMDLSAYFLTPGIADPHFPNTMWRLVETEFVPSGYYFWAGDVDPDGSLTTANTHGQGFYEATPGDFVFFDPFFNCEGFMELQINYPPPPPPPPCPTGACCAAGGP